MIFKSEIGNPLDVPEWDDLLLQSGDHSFFHTRAWAHVLCDTYGYVPVYLIRKLNSRFHLLLPLMEAGGWFAGRRGVSLPFTDFCDAFCAEPEMPDDLFADVEALGHKQGWRSVELRGFAPISNATPALYYYEHSIKLSTDTHALFGQFHDSIRRSIRKTDREDIRCTVEDSESAIRTFYRLNCLTRREHGLPPQPLAFFLSLYRRILAKGQGAVVLAFFKGKPMAGAVFFHFGQRVIFKYGASDKRLLNLRGNHLVMWTSIKWYGSRGFTVLSLGKTSREHDGLRRFKLQWNAEEQIRPYFKYDYGQQRFVQGRDHVSGWHNAVFRHMPIPLARAIGNLLYSYMA
jgi:hypothetical protein